MSGVEGISGALGQTKLGAVVGDASIAGGIHAIVNGEPLTNVNIGATKVTALEASIDQILNQNKGIQYHIKDAATLNPDILPLLNMVGQYIDVLSGGSGDLKVNLASDVQDLVSKANGFVTYTQDSKARGRVQAAAETLQNILCITPDLGAVSWREIGSKVLELRQFQH